jgi:signal transduction histidine kinase/ligand-binding sensor domain-containing protein/DNA-binding response OmpR family regulator
MIILPDIHKQSSLNSAMLKKIAITLITLSFFEMGLGSGYPNNIQFNRITNEQGLSSANIKCILQDHRDYIWFGTNDGLNRYDGYNFTVYFNEVVDSSGLKSSKILDIFEDSQNRLWIGTAEGGVALYDRMSDTFKSYFYTSSKENKLNSNSVFSINEDKAGNLWLGSDNGACRISSDLKKIEYFPLHENSKEKAKQVIVDDIIIDSTNNKIWLATLNEGLFFYDNELKECIQLDLMTAEGTHIKKITTFYQDKDNKLIIGDKLLGLFKFEPPSGILAKIPLSEKIGKSLIYKSILEDQKGNYWISTGSDGVIIMNKQNYNFQIFKEREFDNTSLSSNNIRTMYQSKDNTIWLGTAFDGINYYNPILNKFTHYHRIMGDENSLHADVITDFYELSDSKILISTDGDNLCVFNPVNNTFENQLSALTDRMPKRKSIVFLAGNEKNIYAGSWRGELFKLKYINNKLSFVRMYDEKILGHTLLSAALDDYGYLWISNAQTGIIFFNTNTGRVVDYPHYLGYRFNFGSIGRIMHVINSAGGIWLGTYGNGLYQVKENSVKNFKSEQNSFYSMPNNLVNHIFEDSHGRIWVGCNNGLHYKTDSGFVQLKISQLETSANINAITEDKQGIIWASTNNGLIAYNPKNKSVASYGNEDAIGSLQFAERAVLATSNGNLLFGGNKGFTMFNPGNFVNNNHKPTVHISNLYIFNEKVDAFESSLLSKEKGDKDLKLILNHDTRVFGFQFVVLNYLHSQKNKYAYFLDGFDKEWNYIEDERRITFTNLNPGKYVLYYKGSNNNDLWSETKSLEIEILPPWWGTVWFKSLILLFICGIIYLWYRNNNNQKIVLEALVQKRTQQLKMQNEILEVQKGKLEETDEKKTRFFSNVSHEFRTPITLMVGPIEDLMKEELPDNVKYKLSLVQKNANSLLRIINQVLTFRKIEKETFKLNLNQNNIHEFLTDIGELFSNLAEKRKIQFILKKDTNNSSFWYDPDKLEKIIYNLLSNAYKYSPNNGKIWFSYKFDKKGLELVVEDNGPGIESKKLPYIFDRFYQVEKPKDFVADGTGIGLSLTKNLIELHKGTIHVESKSAKDGISPEETGTLFRVWLPNQKPDDKNTNDDNQSFSLQFTKNMIENEDLILPTGPLNNNHRSEGERLKLLIVEDHVELRKYLANEFSLKYKIIEAEDGIEARELAIADQPDMIISDVMMPRMDGIELCKALKSDIQTSHIPLILLTANTEETSHLDGLKVGADDYLMKPYNLKLLKARINNLLRNRKLLKNKFSTKQNVISHEISSNPTDQAFIDRAFDIIENNLENENFDIELFAQELNISRSLLFKKIKSMIDMSVNDFIFSVKIKKACQLLRTGDYNISETSYKVGFKSVPHFSRKFTEIVGINPREFMQKNIVKPTIQSKYE